MDTWLNSLTAGEECVHSLQLCGDSIKDIVMLLTGFGALHSEAKAKVAKVRYRVYRSATQTRMPAN